MGRVVVCGSANMDLIVSVRRFPRPGETVTEGSLARAPGGKGTNQAVAAARAGAGTALVASVGRDAFGDELVAFLEGEGIDVAGVRRSDAPTGIASIVVAGGENQIVVAPGANRELRPSDVKALELRSTDVLATQLEIPIETAHAFLSSGRACGATTILNAAPAGACPEALVADADVLVVNETELSGLVGRDAPADGIAAEARRLPARVVVVTLGARGALVVTEGGCDSLPAHRVDAVDPTGAGDCLVGSLAARLATGTGLRDALAYAVVAAAVVVQRPGAAPSMPTTAEVRALLLR